MFFSEKAGIVLEAIKELIQIGVKVSSLTTDGPSVNIAMFEALGGSLNAKDIKCEMFISDNGESIYLIFDACHMIKLVCNTFATYKVLKYKGKKIEWLANKVKNAHIQDDKKIMNVRLAVQTLSNSTAAAIDYLREDLKLPEFQDSETTTLFIRIFDKLFDVFNTKSFVGKFYKKLLTIANQCRWEGVLDEADKFIPELTDAHGTPILETRRKTGFIGVLLNIRSLCGIFNRFVVRGPLRFLLSISLAMTTLKFSLDI